MAIVTSRTTYADNPSDSRKWSIGIGQQRLYNGRWVPINSYSNLISRDYKSTIDRMSGEYKTAYDKAKSSNEARYRDILSGYDAMGAKGSKVLDQFGKSATDATNARYRQAQGASTAALARSGMAGSTMTGVLNKSIAQSQGRDLAAIQENVAGQKLNYQSSVEQGKLGVMERREDAYPNEQSYQLALSSIYESAMKQGVPIEELLKYMTLGL